MSDVTHKQEKEKPLEVLKNKSDMLLTRVESFTSKDVSEACRGMDEKILEKLAAMCERISTSREDCSRAALAIVNLYKQKGREETLSSIIEKLETSDHSFLQHAEKFSQVLSPEQFLKLIPVIDSLSKLNQGPQTIRIDEDNTILLTSELVTKVGEQRALQLLEMGRQCADKKVRPTDLYASLISVANKNPTKEQFNAIFDEFSKLIPVLRSEYEVAGKFFMDQPGDEKTFWYRKSDWTLSDLAKKASELDIKEFTEYLHKVRAYDDPFLSMITVQQNDSALVQCLKFDLKSAVTWNAGAIALAVKLSEDPATYKLITDALSQRKGKGYPDMFDFTELFDSIKMLNDFLHSEKKQLIPYHAPEKDFPELMNKEINYIELKKIAQSDQDVKDELSALDEILATCKTQFKRRITVWTHHMDIRAEGLEKTILSSLEAVRDKHLYTGEFRFGDWGTASGAFTSSQVDYIIKNFEKYQIIRTNPTEFKIEYHPELAVVNFDATENPMDTKFNVLVVKDIMKFFNEDGRGKIWENATKSVEDGGFVFSGSAIPIPYGYLYKMHIKVHGELVKVDEEKFLAELKNVKDYQDYTERLEQIVEKCKLN